MQKFTIVLEGGGMRGLFTAGVLDFLMDYNIDPELIIGVSAGALHGINIKSKQKKRSLKISLDYCNDPRYLSATNLVSEGELFNLDFLFGDIAQRFVPFDYDTYAKSKSRLIAVTTNLTTGKPNYHYVVNMRTDFPYVQASSSLPIVGKTRQIGEDLHLDGGVSDSIPVEFALKQKNSKVIVVLTQDIDYRKEKDPSLPLLKVQYHKHPKFIEAMENRHINYNQTVERIIELEEQGKIFVIRPKEKLPISRVEKDLIKMQETYDEGYIVARETYEQLLEYLADEEI